MLEPRRFLVKEQVKLFGPARVYHVHDADTGEQVGTAAETVGLVGRAVRSVVSKALVPTVVEVREKPDDSLVFTITRGRYLVRPSVEVHDAQGALVGTFKTKVLSIRGGFGVLDARGRPFADVTGNFAGFDYRVTTPDGKVELGRVSKTWGGLAKELFTSADTYAVEVNEDLHEQPLGKMLVLAAALAVDLIFKSGEK